jgi:uncharacterized DUF497 family protein
MLESEWDDGNRRHIAFHNVTEDEAEEAFNSNALELAFDIIGDEERIDEVGATMKGRILRIVTILRKTGFA